MPTIKITKMPPADRAAQMMRQIGRYAFIRYLRNLGVPFEDAYTYVFGYNAAISRGII